MRHVTSESIEPHFQKGLDALGSRMSHNRPRSVSDSNSLPDTATCLLVAARHAAWQIETRQLCHQHRAPRHYFVRLRESRNMSLTLAGAGATLDQLDEGCNATPAAGYKHGPAVHARVGTRLPGHSRQLGRRRAQHARSASSVLHVHGPSARPRGIERSGRATPGHRRPRREAADERRAPGADDRRRARLHESSRRCSSRSHSRLHDARPRGRRWSWPARSWPRCKR